MINIGSLVGTLELQDNATAKLVNFDQALNRTFGPFAQFHRQTNVIGIGLQSLGFQLARTGDRLTALTAGVIATGVATVKLATDFQTNMTKIVNLTGMGADGIDKIRESVLRLSPQLAQGPIELSDALYSIGSVGLTGAKALDTMTVSAKASAIGMGETKEVARALSAAVINYADSGMTAARAGDILTAAVREGGAEADQFAGTLGRVIATGKQVGVSFEEITASVATFTRLGVRADEAVTALRGTFSFLMKPAAGVVAELKKLGLGMDDIRKSVKERGLAATLIDLVRIAGEDSDAIGKIIPNVRALAGVLANAGSQAEEYVQILDRVTNSTGTLNTAFEVVSKTAGFKFEQALSRLQVLGIRIGDTLLPVLVDLAESLTPVIDLLTKLVSVFNDLPGPIKVATFAVAGFVLALGPIMSIGGRLVDTFGFFARAFTGLRAIFRGTTAAAHEFAGSIESAFASIRAARAMEFFEEFQRYTRGPAAPTGPRVVSVSTPGGPTVYPGGITVETERIAQLTAASRWATVNRMLAEAQAPLAKYTAGWAKATDSTGQFARQLRAVNPIIEANASLLGRAQEAWRGHLEVISSVNDRWTRTPFLAHASTLEIEKNVEAVSRASRAYESLKGGLTSVVDSVRAAAVAYEQWFEKFTTAPAKLPAVITRSLESASTAISNFATSTRVSFQAAAAAYDAWYTRFTTGSATIPEVLTRPFVAASEGISTATNSIMTSLRGLFTTYDRLFTEFATKPAFEFVKAAEVEKAAPSVARLTQLLLTAGDAAEQVSETTALTVGRVTRLGVSAAEAAPAVGMLARSFGILNPLLDISLVGELWIRFMAFMTDKTALLNFTIDRLISTVGTLAGAFKDMVIILGQMLVDAFNRATGAATNLRDIFLDTSFGQLLEAGFVLILAKIHSDIALIEEAAARIREMARTPVTTESVFQEAEERRKRIAAGQQGSIPDTAVRRLQVQEIQELITVYNELTTSVNRSFVIPNQTNVFDVLAEDLARLRDAAKFKLPENVEAFLKSRGLGVQVPSTPGAPGATGPGLIPHQAGELVESLGEKVGRADKELAGLAKRFRDDLNVAIRSNRFTVTDLVKDYGHLFSSTEMAEIAIKGLQQATRETAKAAERDTRWITTFRNGAKDLEAQLKSAFGKEQLPIGIILEEWGEKAQHTQTRMKALGDSAKGTLIEFVAESKEALEANKPFEQIQKRADDLNRIATAMFSHGRSVAEVYEVLGSSAVDAGVKAAAVGGTMGEALKRLQEEGKRIKLDEVFARVNQEIDEFQRNVARTPASVEELAELNQMSEEWAATAKERVAIIKASTMSDVEQAIAIRGVTQELDFQFKAYRDNMKAIRESQYAIEDLQRAFLPDTLTNRLDDVSIKFKRIRDNISEADKQSKNYGRYMAQLAAEEIQERENVMKAWMNMGRTISNLQDIALDAEAKFKAMRDSGLFTAKDIEEAWKKMVEANIEAQNQWAGHFMSMVASLPDALGDAVAKMMFEAKTFKDFFIGIWQSIAAEVNKIFQDIVASFIRQNLQKLLTGMLTGGTAAAGGAPIDFSAAGLEPMLGGGATAGGGLLSSAGGLMSAGKTNWGMVAGGALLTAAGAYQWKKAEDSKLQNMLGGGMTGAGIGMMVGGPMGAAVGFGVGAVVGLISATFRKPEYKKVMEEIGSGLGVDISEGLAREISDLASTIEGGTKNQRRAIAEILSLDKIIEEGGGLTGANVRTYEAAAMELFGVIERGGKVGKLAVTELNTLVGMFAAQADKTGGVWDKNFQAIIAKAKETGLALENLTAALEAQMSKLAGGIDKLTAGFAAETKKSFIAAFKDLPGGKAIAEKFWDALGDPDAMKKALEGMGDDFVKMFEDQFKGVKGLDDVAEDLWKVIGDPKALERALDRLDLKPEVEKKVREFLAAFDVNKITGQVGAAAQAQFDRLSRISFAAFNAIVAQGKSAVEAIDTIGDSVDRLIELHDKLGLKGGAAYDALARFRNLVKDNRELVDSALGLNDAMVALQNLGGMTVDLFSDMQLEGQGIYERLTAAGFTSKEALKMMAPFLQNVVKIAKEFGYEIDANTQALIDQADEQGVLDKKMMDTNEILMRGFAAIITALGGPLPDAFKEFADDAVNDANRVNDALDHAARDRRTRITVDTETGETIPGGGTEPGPEGEPRPPTYDVGGLVRAYGNLRGVDFRSRGDDTIPALLSPGEMVLTQGDQTALLNMIRDPTPDIDTTPKPGVTINIEEGAFSGMLAGATVDSPERARELAYAIVNEFEKRGKLWNKARNALGVAS